MQYLNINMDLIGFYLVSIIGKALLHLAKVLKQVKSCLMLSIPSLLSVVLL